MSSLHREALPKVNNREHLEKKTRSEDIICIRGFGAERTSSLKKEVNVNWNNRILTLNRPLKVTRKLKTQKLKGMDLKALRVLKTFQVKNPVTTMV